MNSSTEYYLCNKCATEMQKLAQLEETHCIAFREPKQDCGNCGRKRCADKQYKVTWNIRRGEE